MYKKLITLSFLFFLVGCTQEKIIFNESSSPSQRQVSNALDKDISLDPDLNFKTIDTDEKLELYKELDQITTSPTTIQPSTYSNVEILETESDLKHVLREPESILYFGYDECPFCKAMLPKVNQMAKSYGQTIYYINTKVFDSKETYQNIHQTLNFEYVPAMYSIKDKVATQHINAASSMETIENFFKSLE